MVCPQPVGAPVVFLHGLGTGPLGWRPQLDDLGRDRAIAAPRLPLELGRAAAVLADEVTRAGGLVDLCGLSFGGLVALRYAAEHPSRVRRLVVTAAFARLPAPLRAAQLVLASAARVASHERLVRGVTAELPEPHRSAARQELATRSRAELTAVMRAAARLDMRTAVAAVTTPALVLCGDRDRVNRGLSHRLAEALPAAQFRLVPEAGHAANLDNPVVFTRLLRGFLDRDQPPVPSSSSTPCG
jgi:pimeloyl-ACP methyl ester carboxylesterase